MLPQKAGRRGGTRCGAGAKPYYISIPPTITVAPWNRIVRTFPADLTPRSAHNPNSRTLADGSPLCHHTGGGPATIDGGSMATTHADGSLVLVDRLTYQLDAWPSPVGSLGKFVRRGDVILLRRPTTPSLTRAKRLVALPGDRVAFDHYGRISVCLSSTVSREFGCDRAEAILRRVCFALWPLGARGPVRQSGRPRP